MKLIIMGAPGAGKGTQAARISRHLSIPAISTGDILREAIAAGTKMGELAKTYIDQGRLVPDDVMIGIIKDRLSQEDCRNGYILDGFPRTIPQAEALDALGADIDKVLSIEVSDDTIVERMAGRRVCPKCGATFHTDHNPPKVEGICDKCGAELIRRKDDAPETVQARLKVYHDQTEPLKDYYQRAGKLVIAEGQEDVEDTTATVFSALEV
ncbi:MAG TPA: adenylate kinase [Candidatus Onthovicinus excrementipullorum]|nr:adenylate kinase [Candidatus Onthovicinus excrementipullorum]